MTGFGRMKIEEVKQNGLAYIHFQKMLLSVKKHIRERIEMQRQVEVSQ